MSHLRTFSPASTHVLLIGIDDYLSSEYGDLKNAVGDATKFQQYLVQDLAVPSCNVNMVLNKSASRDNIIAALHALKNDNTIVKNRAAFIIYYAGHGAYGPKPDAWTEWEVSGGDIEMLCPTDIGMIDATGKFIEGIPDRTIGALLDELSQAKGNNITIILDCCCLAGITRATLSAATNRGLTPRFIASPPRISNDCDSDIWSTHQRGAHGFSGSARESHVLLAACNSRQFAYEGHEGGLFTHVVLQVLRTHGIEDLTYSSLIHRLPYLHEQTPHCAGKNITRRIFDVTSEGADRSLILCRVATGRKQLILQAGALHGVKEALRDFLRVLCSS